MTDAQDSITHKTCSKCEIEKPITAFRSRGGKQPHLWQSWCRACRSRYNIPYQQANAGKYKDRKYTRKNYKEIYKASGYVVESRTCPACNIHKPASEFWRNRRAKYGLCCYCKECFKSGRDTEAKRERKRYLATLENGTPKARNRNRNWRLKRHFGITLEEFNAMLAAQNNKCAICHIPSDVTKLFHVDHDHRCCPRNYGCEKCIRGLLCYKCNAAVGMLNDSIEVLASAIEYLKNNRATHQFPPRQA